MAQSTKTNSNQELEDLLHDFIDKLEDRFGEVAGFEVRIEHPIFEGERQSFADIKEFTLIYLTRENVDIKQNEYKTSNTNKKRP